MNPVDKASRKEKDDTMAPDDPSLEWTAEDAEIEGRKPDLGETEEDPSEI